jgi:carbon monoxide dehydrogenase subunit G
MRITGTVTLKAPVEQVWAGLHDVALLRRAIPGCEQFDALGGGTCRTTLSAGVASFQGTFQGEVKVVEERRPASLRLKATGVGQPGTVTADITLGLTDAGDGTTRVDYDVEAVVGGQIASIGSRLLAAAATKAAREFFAAVDAAMGGAATAAETAPRPSPPHAAATKAPEAATTAAPGRTFAALAAAPVADGDDVQGAVLGALLGAGVALLGVLVGGVLGRRR